MSWTITYNGTENTLAGWGIRLEMPFDFSNKGKDVVNLVTCEPFDPATPQFAWGGAILIQRDRTYSGGWSGGTIWFQGYVGELTMAADGTNQAVGYQIFGPWWLLERLQFKQSRNVFNGWTVPGNPHSGATFTTVFDSESFLGESLAEDEFTGVQQITEILNWANECWNPTKQGATSGRNNAYDVLTIGTINAANVFPKTRQNTVSCASALLTVLGWFPGVVVQWNYQTTPPTLNLIDQTGATPYSITLSANQEKRISVAPQYERQLAGVIICYRQVNLENGVPFKNLYFDRWPATTTDYTPNVLTHTLDLAGWSVTSVSCPVIVNPFYGSNALSSDTGLCGAWWATIDASLQDPLIQASTIKAQTISVTATNGGGTVDPSVYQNILVPGSAGSPSGPLASWMGVSWVDATITATVAFAKYRDSAHNQQSENVTSKVITHRVILTNATTTTYSAITGYTTGDPVPSPLSASGSLAYQMYQAMATLQYQGTVTFEAGSLRSDIAVGQVVSLVGPHHTFSPLIVQSIQGNPVTGEMTVSFGPRARLEIGQMFEMWRASRWYTTYNMPSGRSDASAAPAATLDTSGTATKENTAHGIGTYTLASTSYDQGTTSGNPNGVTLIKHDAQNEAIVVGRVSSAGTPVTNDGAGNPIGTINIALAATAGKTIALQTMSNGSKVLASSDFTGGGGASWRGEYSGTTATYNVGDIVMVSTGGRSGYNDAQLLGVWVCLIQNGTATTPGAQFPVYPYPSTNYWHLISFPPQQIYTCNGGANSNNYANMSGSF